MIDLLILGPAVAFSLFMAMNQRNLKLFFYFSGAYLLLSFMLTSFMRFLATLILLLSANLLLLIRYYYIYGEEENFSLRDFIEFFKKEFS